MKVRVLTTLSALVLGLLLALAAPLLAQQASPPPGDPASPATVVPAPVVPAPVVPAPPVAPVAPPKAPSAVLPPEVLEPIARLSRSVETAEKSIQQLKEIEGELSRLRAEVERIIYESTATAESLRPQLAEVKSQVEKLGPPPAKDQPPESAVVASERARLNELAGALDGAVKTAELAWIRAKQMIDRITVLRYQQFTRNLLERRDSPMLPGIWRDVGSRLETIVGRMHYYGGDWLDWAGRRSHEAIALGVAALAFLVLGIFAVGRFVAHRLPRLDPSPSFFERAIKAAWVAPLRMLPLAGAALILYTGLDALGLLFPPWNGPGNAILAGLVVFAASSGLLGTALSPRNPSWRLFPVADGTASRLLLILKAFVAVYAIDTVLVEFGRAIYVPLTVTIVQSFLSSLLSVALLGLLLLTPFHHLIGPDRPVNGHAFVPSPVTRNSPLWLKLPLWLVAVMILVASMLGYIALGRFVAQQLVLSGVVVLGAGLLYLAIRAATRGRADGNDMIGNAVARQFGLDAPRQRQLSRLIELALTLLVGLVALPALLVQWGFSGADVRDWLKALLFGFEIGQFRISLVRIFIAIALFIALLFLTRLVQRSLRERVLVQPRMDAGIANSIETAVGYAGTALALLVAVSYGGLDITNLAIVASALAVGVGFGLQSIVNNFVSGLILLVERPIKVGDWIVVGNEQGNVRRISVRSTEIETFDRASLIVPNSELITGRVLNWTHRNLLGRTILKITVDPNADPERVLAILKTCAEAHAEVLKTPPINASFDNFNGNGLDFTLRVTLGDVTRGNIVATELRVAILKALRDSGIVMPNPQFDIHLRDLDFVKSMVQRAAEQRAADAAQPPRQPMGDGVVPAKT